ncbi:MAG: winged helix-turn-helix domain-containing protein [Planctomycetaceae bacterium]|nr:winged helix-turn-helix domain-containing protein [Planctomycetaceae bacterium]
MSACERYFQQWDIRHDVYWYWCSDECPDKKPEQIAEEFKKDCYIAAFREAEKSGVQDRLRELHEKLLFLDQKVRDSWELMRFCSPVGEDKLLLKFDDAREALQSKILELRHFIDSLPLLHEEIAREAPESGLATTYLPDHDNEDRRDPILEIWDGIRKSKQRDLLRLLIESEGTSVSRNQVVMRVWGADGCTDENLGKAVLRINERIGRFANVSLTPDSLVLKRHEKDRKRTDKID